MVAISTSSSGQKHHPHHHHMVIRPAVVRWLLLLGTLLAALLATTYTTPSHSELLLLDLEHSSNNHKNLESHRYHNNYDGRKGAVALPEKFERALQEEEELDDAQEEEEDDDRNIHETDDASAKEKDQENQQPIVSSASQQQLSPKERPSQPQQISSPPQDNNDDHPTATIAYAISLVKCGDHQSTSAGLVDAALVLRHSIHLTSWRHNVSRYDYHMVAIVHRDAVECSLPLKQAGFTIVVVDPPLQPSDIVGSEYLKKEIHKEWCCGHDEFIKLFAYQLPVNPYTGVVDPIVVHVDIDFSMYQPMDALFDAMLFDKDTPRGQRARHQLHLERPDDVLPDRIDAYITRDYPQLLPGRIPGYQAGFLVARHDPTVLPEVLHVIQYSNYTEGFGRDNGWGGKGYGGYVGAMAMQGLMAYYYDVVRPATVVELNSCRYNHMGMDNLYRNYPAFYRRKGYKEWIGKCRSQRPDCEDCTVTNFTNIYNVHYTQCRKPWNCVGTGAPGGTIQGTGNNTNNNKNKANAIDTNTGKFEHCVPLIRAWHQVRVDLETALYDWTRDQGLPQGRTGDYQRDMFLGHCTGEGGYLQLQAQPSSLAQLAQMYHDPEPKIVTVAEG